MCIFFGTRPAQSAITMEYQNGSFGYRIEKTMKYVKFDDSYGHRRLKIQNCNKYKVIEFFNRIDRIISNVQKMEKRKRSTASRISIKYLGVEFEGFPMDPILSDLQSIPSKLDLLFLESSKLCSK